MTRNRLHSALLAAACLAVVATVGWRAGAESAETRLAPPPPATIAIVDVQRALNSLEELQDINTKLEARFNERQTDLNKLADQGKDLQAQLDASAPDDL